jgi:hypothetical protein
MTAAGVVWLANDTSRAAMPGRAGQSARAGATSSDLTCRLPNAPPSAFLSAAAGTRGAIRRYSGTIGNRPVTVMLQATARDLSGYYIYDAIEQPIQLRGRLTDRGFTLTEFGDLREPSTSTGSFDMAGSFPADALQGTWRSPGGTRTLRVRLDTNEPFLRHRILLTWERRAASEGFQPWQEEVDYSPARNELIYLEQPNVVAALDLFSMRRRILTRLGPEAPHSPLRPGQPPLVDPWMVQHIVVSHAGDRLVFSAGPLTFPDIYVMDLGDPRPVRLTDSMGDFQKQPPYFYYYWVPQFSPDDRLVLFAINHGPRPNTQIAAVPASGGQVQRLREHFDEPPYWFVDGTSTCTYSDGRGPRKIVYDARSGTARVDEGSSSSPDREKRCRLIGDVASIDTCIEPAGNDPFADDSRFRGAGAHLSQRWVTPDVVINRYELSGGRPGYRIQVVQLLD